MTTRYTVEPTPGTSAADHLAGDVLAAMAPSYATPAAALRGWYRAQRRVRAHARERGIGFTGWYGSARPVLAKGGE